jgi:hypothetical protein
MPRISLGSRVARDTTQVIDRVVDEEALLIHLQSGTYFSLNQVGTRVWEIMDGSKTVAELAAVIASEYEVSQEQAQTDVSNLVNELVEEKLVILTPA